MTWTEIGTFDTDSGLCWIGDPCRLSGVRGPLREVRGPLRDWSAFCNDVGGERHKMFKDGVVASTGYGNGQYRVMARISDVGDGWGERVREVRIVFDEEAEGE